MTKQTLEIPALADELAPKVEAALGLSSQHILGSLIVVRTAMVTIRDADYASSFESHLIHVHEGPTAEDGIEKTLVLPGEGVIYGEKFNDDMSEVMVDAIHGFSEKTGKDGLIIVDGSQRHLESEGNGTPAVREALAELNTQTILDGKATQSSKPMSLVMTSGRKGQMTSPNIRGNDISKYYYIGYSGRIEVTYPGEEYAIFGSQEVEPQTSQESEAEVEVSAREYLENCRKIVSDPHASASDRMEAAYSLNMIKFVGQLPGLHLLV